MKNEVQGLAKIHVLYKTNMSVEEFLHKFQEDNIIDQKLVTTLSDGSVHTFQVCELMNAIITNFIVNGEEIIEEEIEVNKKVTKLNNSATKKLCNSNSHITV